MPITQDLHNLIITIFYVKLALIGKNNKPKGLKVAKEVLMSIGSMVDRLDGR